MFDNAIFSNDGLELLGQLTATKTLEICEVYADTTQLDASTVNNSVEWWENQTATTMQEIAAGCTAASKFDGQARLLLTFGGGEATLKTLVVTACAVESGVRTNEVVLCMASDDVGIKVFDTTSMDVHTNVALMFKFSNTSSITVSGLTTTEYALQGDLERLVSCHKAAEPSVGENQTILGNKTFKNNISAHIASFARINSETTGTDIILGRTMRPTVDLIDLGTADYPFNNIYVDNIKGNKTLTVSAVGDDKATYTTVITPEKLTCTGTYGTVATPIVNEIKYSKNEIYIAHDLKRPFEFSWDTSTSKSKTTLAGDSIYLDGFITNDLGCTFNGYCTFNNTVRFTQPVTGNVTCSGTLFAKSIVLDGQSVSTPDKLAPSTSGTTLTLNVGGIVKIFADYQTFSGYGLGSTLGVGYQFASTSSSDLYICKQQSGSNIPVRDTRFKLPVGQYALLESCSITTTDGVSLLVQRIA